MFARSGSLPNFLFKKIISNAIGVNAVLAFW